MSICSCCHTSLAPFICVIVCVTYLSVPLSFVTYAHTSFPTRDFMNLRGGAPPYAASWLFRFIYLPSTHPLIARPHQLHTHCTGHRTVPSWMCVRVQFRSDLVSLFIIYLICVAVHMLHLLIIYHLYSIDRSIVALFASNYYSSLFVAAVISIWISTSPWQLLSYWISIPALAPSA